MATGLVSVADWLCCDARARDDRYFCSDTAASGVATRKLNDSSM